MPNWCNNTITIKGSVETVKALWDQANLEDSGLLDAMVPMPELLKGTTSPTPQPGQANYAGPQPVVDGFDNWYDWSVKNWGVKWDVSTEGLEFEDHGDGTASITGWFDSPWGPPIEAVNKFSDDADGAYVELFYHEPGMAFVGCWDSEGGDDYYDYASADDIPDYLDEHFGIREQIEMWEEETA